MKIYFYFFICFVLLACRGKQAADDGKVRRTEVILSKLEPVEVDRLIDSVRYIKLETSDEAIIARIDKIVFQDSLIYLADTRSNAVFVYDRAGKYRFKIASQGPGPEEYINLMDFTVDPAAGSVDVLDMHKIVRYDMSDGKFIESISLDHPANYLLATANKGYLLFSLFTGLAQVDDRGENLKILDKYDAKYPIVTNNEGYMYRCPGDSAGYFSPIDYTMYRVRNGKLTPVHAFTFPDHVTPGDFPGYSSMNYPEKLKSNGVEILAHQETPSWIFQRCGIIKDEVVLSYLYSKKEDRLYLFSFIKNFPGVILPSWIVQENANNCLVMTSNANASDMLKEMLARNPQVGDATEFKRILDGMSEDDNPLLQLIYLKE